MLTSKKIAVLLLSASISLGAFEAQAAQNLVGATLSTTGVDAGFTAALDSQLRIGTAYPVAYRLTNNVGIDIQGFAVKPVISGPAKFDVVSNDCPAVLPVGASCDFTGNVTATAAGEVTLQIHLVEGGNTFLLHKDVATAVPQAPNLVESSTLAKQYFANASNNGVEFTFTNNGVDTAVVSSVNLSDSASLLSQVINNCSGATIASGASCKITAVLNSKTTATKYNLGFMFNYHEASSGNEVLSKTFDFPVTMVDTSKLEVVSAPNRIVAKTGGVQEQGTVTLQNTGAGDIVGISASVPVNAVNNGTLTVDESASTCQSNVILPAEQTCKIAVDFTASSQAVDSKTASYKSALATVTISYQDGVHANPTLQQSVLAVQADVGYPFPQAAAPTKDSAVSAMVFADNTLYVGTPDNGLLMSSDHGANWTQAIAINGLPSNDVVAVSANGNEVAVATNNGIALSNDSGFYFQPQLWTAGGTPQAIAQTTSDNITTLYVGTTTGLYSSVDEGVSFTQVAAGVILGDVTAVGVDSSKNVYAIANHALYIKNGESFAQIVPVDGSCQVNGLSVYNGYTFVASNCGVLMVDGSQLSNARDLPRNNLSAISVADAYMFYSIKGTDLFSGNINNKSLEASNDTGLTSPDSVVLDSDGIHIYVGSSTGGFVVGTIDPKNPLVVTFPSTN